MKILEIVSIPVFMSLYMQDKKYSYITDDFYCFCQLLTRIEFKFNPNKNNYYAQIPIEFKDIIKFIAEKSKIDCKGFCKYEDELDIPKCISNEVFEVYLDDYSVIKFTILETFNNETNELGIIVI